MSILDALRKDKLNIINRYQSGDSTVILGKDYNCNPAMIWTLLKENNVKVKSRSKFYGNMEDYKEEICKLFNEDYSCNKISKLLGLCDSTVAVYLKKWGYDPSKKRTRKDGDLIENYKDEMILLYNSGILCDKIGKKFGFTGSGIFRNLNKWGVDTSVNQHKYDVKEDFLRSGVDTQEKAYFLGLMFADGSVDIKGKMRISLQEGDRDILDKLKDVLGYTGELHHIDKGEGRYKQKCLCINRKALTDDIIRLGCPPNKAFKLKFPTKETVPDELIWHFIRGYVDGDGSITKNYANVTGCYDFVYGLSSLLDDLGIVHQIYQRYKERPAKKSSHSLFVGQRRHRLKFCQLLYKDSTIHLNRKYQKACDLIFKDQEVAK